MPWRLTRNLALGGAGIACLWMGIRWARDYDTRLFSPFEGFARRAEFSLLDSLPALSPGLGELEAFKLTADPSSKTDASRSLWLSDSLRRISLEYYSGRSAFDSATFYLWTSDSVVRSRVLRGARHLAWNVPCQRGVDGWTEVVGVYVSRPRLLDFRTRDSSVRAFEAIEGKTLHVVRRRYRDHKEKVLAPDTAYPARERGGLQLWARGDALALVNPSPRPVRLRIIRLRERRWDICVAEGRRVHVYRNLLKGYRGPVLAYTSPGKTYPIFSAPKRTDAYFWLEPRP